MWSGRGEDCRMKDCKMSLGVIKSRGSCDNIWKMVQYLNFKRKQRSPAGKTCSGSCVYFEESIGREESHAPMQQDGIRIIWAMGAIKRYLKGVEQVDAVNLSAVIL